MFNMVILKYVILTTLSDTQTRLLYLSSFIRLSVNIEKHIAHNDIGMAVCFKREFDDSVNAMF